MRLSTLGAAVTGTSTIGVNGATPAALVGVTGGSKFGPAWLSTSKIAYQNVTAGAIVQSYDIVSTATATLSATGQNDLAAGNSKWAKFLSGTGVTTNISVGPFATAALGDVSTDFGELAITLNYPSGPGITVYSSAGATLLSLPAITAGPIIRIRGHLMVYQSMTGVTGWFMANVLGGAFSFAPRIDEPINWTTPVTTASGKTLVMERSNRLTLRYADKPNGWQIVAPGTNTFNPDVMEVSAGVIRLAWSANQGESPDALQLTDLTLATGATRNGVIVAGAISWSTGPTLPGLKFAIGALQGANSNPALEPPVRQPVTLDNGLMTRPWQDWSRAVAGNGTSNTSAISAIPPSTTPNAFSTIAAAGQTPIVANGATSLTFTGATLDNITNTVTITGLGGDVTHTAGALTVNQLVIGNSGADIKVLGSLGTTTTVLHGNAAGAPSFSAVALGADVTGRLPYANFVAATAASRVLVRTSSSAGDWQEGTLGAGLALSGTVLNTVGIVMQGVPVLIVNADILTLPTIVVPIVAAPAAGFRYKFLGFTFRAHIVTAYTGINATYSDLRINQGGSYVTTALTTDSAYAVTQVDSFLGTIGDWIVDVPCTYLTAFDAGTGGTTPGEFEYVLPTILPVADVDGVAAALTADNGGVDYGGGNAANTLLITPYWVLEAV